MITAGSEADLGNILEAIPDDEVMGARQTRVTGELLDLSDDALDDQPDLLRLQLRGCEHLESIG